MFVETNVGLSSFVVLPGLVKKPSRMDCIMNLILGIYHTTDTTPFWETIFINKELGPSSLLINMEPAVMRQF